jgi:hypothetical protein
MTMTASSHLTRRRQRDPEDEVETTVFSRPVLHWDRAMVAKMTRDLAIPRVATPRRLPAPSPLPAPSRAATIQRPNVFLTPRTPADPVPLWEMPPRPPREEDAPSSVSSVRTRTPAREPSRKQRRSILPWVAFAMCFGIAFGVGNDRALRAELLRDLGGAKGPIAAAISAGNAALQRVVAAERAKAPRPLPSP